MIDSLDDIFSKIEEVNCLFYKNVQDLLVSNGILDISSAQAVIVYRMGDKKIMIKHVMDLGIYKGTNPTYNLKQLVKNGYVAMKHDKKDKRVSIIRVTDKGSAVSNIVRCAQRKVAESMQDIDAVDYALNALIESFPRRY